MSRSIEEQLVTDTTAQTIVSYSFVTTHQAYDVSCSGLAPNYTYQVTHNAAISDRYRLCVLLNKELNPISPYADIVEDR